MPASMTDGWFAGLDPDDGAGAAERISDGTADAPAAWPQQAVESEFVEDTEEYYERPHAATVDATEAAVTERDRADDQQLAHAVRAMAGRARKLY